MQLRGHSFSFSLALLDRVNHLNVREVQGIRLVSKYFLQVSVIDRGSLNAKNTTIKYMQYIQEDHQHGLIKISI